MHLDIILPRDRKYAGFFTLIDSEGVLVLAGRALGKADNGRAVTEGNPARRSVLPYGDTPTGDYHAARMIKLDPPHRRIGKLWIPLKGKSGDALQAIAEGRRKLGIHAGRLDTDGRLVPTYGCVRFSDRDIEQLWGALNDVEVSITISEED